MGLNSDPRAAGLLVDGLALGFSRLRSLDCQDLYFIEGNVSSQDLERLAHELLSDPITQTAIWGRLDSIDQRDKTGQHVLEVALRPGVTDPVAEQIVRGAAELGIQGVERAATGMRYVFNDSEVDEADLHRLARRLLFNPVIQRYALGEIEPSFPHPAQASGHVDILPLRDLNDNGLVSLSQ
jgi:phosphoribosylformylglycinamidine synthase